MKKNLDFLAIGEIHSLKDEMPFIKLIDSFSSHRKDNEVNEVNCLFLEEDVANASPNQYIPAQPILEIKDYFSNRITKIVKHAISNGWQVFSVDEPNWQWEGVDLQVQKRDTLMAKRIIETIKNSKCFKSVGIFGNRHLFTGEGKIVGADLSYHARRSVVQLLKDYGLQTQSIVINRLNPKTGIPYLFDLRVSSYFDGFNFGKEGVVLYNPTKEPYVIPQSCKISIRQSLPNNTIWKVLEGPNLPLMFLKGPDGAILSGGYTHEIDYLIISN